MSRRGVGDNAGGGYGGALLAAHASTAVLKPAVFGKPPPPAAGSPRSARASPEAMDTRIATTARRRRWRPSCERGRVDRPRGLRAVNGSPAGAAGGGARDAARRIVRGGRASQLRRELRALGLGRRSDRARRRASPTRARARRRLLVGLGTTAPTRGARRQLREREAARATQARLNLEGSALERNNRQPAGALGRGRRRGGAAVSGSGGGVWVSGAGGAALGASPRQR